MSDPNLDTLKSRMRHALAASGLRLRELSRASGVSPGTISRLQNGDRHGSRPETIRALATAMRVSFEWLATGDGPRPALDALALPIVRDSAPTESADELRAQLDEAHREIGRLTLELARAKREGSR